MSGIKVTGIKELNRALRTVDKGLPKEVQREFKALAATIAGKASAKVPRRSGRAASSVKPRATQRGAAIAAGGARAPHYPWLDFGGSTGRGHQPGQSWSGSVTREAIKGGRYIYPTIGQERQHIEDAAREALVRVAAKGDIRLKEE